MPVSATVFCRLLSDLAVAISVAYVNFECNNHTNFFYLSYIHTGYINRLPCKFYAPPSSTVMAKLRRKTLKSPSPKSSGANGTKKISAAITAAVQLPKRVRTSTSSSKASPIAGSIHSASSSVFGSSGILFYFCNHFCLR